MVHSLNDRQFILLVIVQNQIVDNNRSWDGIPSYGDPPPLEKGVESPYQKLIGKRDSDDYKFTSSLWKVKRFRGEGDYPCPHHTLRL